MGTISIVFRVPVVDVSDDHAGPFKNFEASDNRPSNQWRSCSHKHRTKATALKCARSMSLGQDWSAENERVEIRGFDGKYVNGVRVK